MYGVLTSETEQNNTLIRCLRLTLHTAYLFACEKYANLTSRQSDMLNVMTRFLPPDAMLAQYRPMCYRFVSGRSSHTGIVSKPRKDFHLDAKDLAEIRIGTSVANRQFLTIPATV